MTVTYNNTISTWVCLELYLKYKIKVHLQLGGNCIELAFLGLEGRFWNTLSKVILYYACF